MRVRQLAVVLYVIVVVAWFRPTQSLNLHISSFPKTLFNPSRNVKRDMDDNRSLSESLLRSIGMVQSRESRKTVEALVSDLSLTASKYPNMFMKDIKVGKAYRTVWSTVTSDTPAGFLLKQKPSRILGGDSWQVIDKSGTKGENIVYWRIGNLGIRMVGLSDLKPLGSKKGYELIIRGLSFRWKLMDKDEIVPESNGLMGSDAEMQSEHVQLFYLQDHQLLSSGQGTLEVLYNDGDMRITCDSQRSNVYVHIAEQSLEKYRLLL